MKMYFNVGIEGLDNKIWRDIVVSSDYSLAEFGYLILSIFGITSSEYFSFWCGNNNYDCVLPLYDSEICKSALNVYLKNIDFKKNNKIKLIYDYNNKIEFNIKYLEMKNDYEGDVPFVINGEGKGAIDFVSGIELKEIVLDTDSTGVSSFSSSFIDENDEEIEEVYDYRDFDLEECNSIGLLNAEFVRDDYETLTILDFFRVIKQYKTMYYKSDIKEIVNPFDYMRKYYEMSDRKREKVRIPSEEELKIYRLPDYEELDHKYIMSYYVKKYIQEKDVRRDLFYALRNYDYMDKFYNILRKYGLFRDYLDKTKYYYKEKFEDWINKNNIEI